MKTKIKNKYLRPYYEKYWGSIVGDHLKDLNIRIKAIKPFFPQGYKGNILDFGCGRGEILSELTILNPKAKVFGLDISQKAIKHAKKIAPKAIIKSIIESKIVPIESGSIDHILAIDVVEHVYDTEWMFNEFSRMLKKGGTILISTPYCGFIKNIFVAIFGYEKVYEPLGPHIRYYTKKSLEECLALSGLQTLHFGTFGRFYPLSKGMYIVAKKVNNKKINYDKYCV